MSELAPQSSLRTSTADAVTNKLRREILDGTIAAGSRIMPKDLAERYQVSIVPIREALRRLEAEALVVTSPQRATYAAEIGLEDLSGVYDLRRILEAELASRACDIATEEDRNSCRSAFEQLKSSEPHSPEFYEAHRLFHWRLLEPASSTVSHKVLEQLWQSVDRYMFLAAKRLPEAHSPEYMDGFYAEHALLVTAFESGEGEHLRDLLVEHLTSTENKLKRAYQIQVLAEK